MLESLAEYNIQPIYIDKLLNFIVTLKAKTQSILDRELHKKLHKHMQESGLDSQDLPLDFEDFDQVITPITQVLVELFPDWIQQENLDQPTTAQQTQKDKIKEKQDALERITEPYRYDPKADARAEASRNEVVRNLKQGLSEYLETVGVHSQLKLELLSIIIYLMGEQRTINPHTLSEVLRERIKKYQTNDTHTSNKGEPPSADIQQHRSSEDVSKLVGAILHFVRNAAPGWIDNLSPQPEQSTSGLESYINLLVDEGKLKPHEREFAKDPRVLDRLMSIFDGTTNRMRALKSAAKHAEFFGNDKLRFMRLVALLLPILLLLGVVSDRDNQVDFGTIGTKTEALIGPLPPDENTSPEEQPKTTLPTQGENKTNNVQELTTPTDTAPNVGSQEAYALAPGEDVMGVLTRAVNEGNSSENAGLTSTAEAAESLSEQEKDQFINLLAQIDAIRNNWPVDRATERPPGYKISLLTDHLQLLARAIKVRGQNEAANELIN